MDRLPRGRHGLSREFVAHNQRERLIAALAEAVYENGYDKTTVALIAKQASISKADFYKHFESKDECFFAAYDLVVQRVRELTTESCRGRKKWATKVHDALAALLGFFAQEPALANLVLVESLRGGREIYARYEEALQGFVTLLSDGAPRGQAAGARPVGTDQAVVGGVASLLGRRVMAGEAAQLEELLPEMLEFTLTPYLGTSEARRITSA